jgi:hypothetical protein
MKKPLRAKPESAAAKGAAATSGIPEAEKWDHWWKHSPFMMVDNYGHYVSKPGAEFWFKNFWQPRMFSAWAYELVRRLTKLKLKEPELAQLDDAILRSLPPYPQLTWQQKKFFAAIMASQFTLHRPAQMLGTGASWREGQSFKVGDWRQIEALDLRADKDERQARRPARKYIRRYWPLIRAAWMNMPAGPQIVFNEPRPRHELSGCGLTERQIRNALRSIH